MSKCLFVSLLLFFFFDILFIHSSLFLLLSCIPQIRSSRLSFSRMLYDVSMNVDIVYYRAMIGLFNIVKLNRGKISSINMVESLICTLMHIYTCVSICISKFLEFIFFPFCMVLFLTLNLFPFKLLFPVSDDFTIFQTTSHVYIHISLKFAYIIISHNVFALLSNLKAYVIKVTDHDIFLDLVGGKCP